MANLSVPESEFGWKMENADCGNCRSCHFGQWENFLAWVGDRDSSCASECVPSLSRFVDPKLDENWTWFT